MSTEQDSNDLETIYANDETENLINVSELLKTKSVDELLKENQEDITKLEKENLWYHGRIDRHTSEEILKKGLAKFGNIDGLFLVRESTSSPGPSFVLSIVSKGIFFHFQVNEVKTLHFRIDEGPVVYDEAHHEGPVVYGLDKLIQRYQRDALGLPSQLNQQFCRCKSLPDSHRFAGVTNLLHRAVLENIPDVVQQILDSKYCPPIDAKNEWGSTALHDACFYGFEDITAKLVRRDADVNMFDQHGHTSLHRCCSNNKGGIISILIQEGKANINARNPKNGWIPIHMAAFKGHLDCMKILLDYHSPYLPRSDDGTTPQELADTYENPECAAEIDNFEPPKISAHSKDWFHPELDRIGAQQLLELKGLWEGMFIIRKSHRNLEWHVLTLCHQHKVFNYEIKTKNYRDRYMHYIDDGPFFRSIEHLIQYYCYSANGLPCPISVSINSAREIIQIKEEDEYFNLMDQQRPTVTATDVSKPGHSTPDLPPRPPLLAEELKISTTPEPKASPPPLRVTPPPPPNHPPPTKSIVRSQSIPEPKAPVLELNRIDKKHLKIGSEIGQGEFGSVMKGVYKKPQARGHKKIDVAIKMLNRTSINNKEDFLKEARTMQQLHHECIVNFIGIAELETHELMLVEDYIAMGSMLDYLLDYTGEINTKIDLYLWASQIAYGMMYLEEKKMVHRDLAARNILLQSKKQAKISDFGLSRAVGTNSDYYKATTGGRWPIKWYAPECVNYGHFSHGSDVWSFGVTLWEMFSFGEPPYGDMKGIQVIQYIEEGKRLEKPPDCPQSAYNQMRKCWSQERKDRPNFRELNCYFERDDEYACVRDLIKRD